MEKELGDRMKEYERCSDYVLTRRVPVVLRIDGKAFHTFTKGFVKPFDKIMLTSMQETMRSLCENIQGAKLGYVQSDEISIVLTDYDTIKTDCYFGNRVAKISSIVSSMATLYFNRYFSAKVAELNEEEKLRYEKALHKGAMFDCRVFNVPKEEVCNYFLWRQSDAEKNSINSVGQANFSQKQMNGKNLKQVQEMLFQEKSINWNEFSIPEKRGTCAIRDTVKLEDGTERVRWVLDVEIPRFINEHRNYVNSRILYKEDLNGLDES